MSALDDRDIAALRKYADDGNRIRYWNYLAHHEGNDGYGLLALGVVRNDSMPGAVANAYAQGMAQRHDGIALSERQWETFGRTLVREDFARRMSHFDAGERDLALNLPAHDVQEAHAASFALNHVTPDAWTPNILLNAARSAAGEAAVERVWSTMMDNQAIGLSRLGKTSYGIVSEYESHVPDWRTYMADLTKAEMSALSASPQVDPDRISRGTSHYEYDGRSKSWTSYIDTDVAEFGFRSPSERVTDPALIRDLDDAREVRLERRQMTEKVHPDDPYREIARSPHTIADVTAPPSPSVDAAMLARSVDPALYDDLRTRLPEGTSPDRLAQVTLAAKQADIRAGDVQGLSLQNDSTLLVHGRQPGDRAVVDLSTPPPTVEQTLAHADAYAGQQAQQWTQFQSEQQQIEIQAQQQAQAQLQARQTPSQSGPTLSGPRMG
jgi:hypothetical protein